MSARLLWVIGLVAAALVLGSVAAGVAAQGPKPQVLQAALGSGFTYQGQLKNGSQPFSGSCNMQFSLWDSAGNNTGQVGGTQALPSVPVNNGLFTVVLNDSAQFGASAFDGNARWLKVAVQCGSDTGFTALSRQPITAAPYALYATNAGSVPWRGVSSVPATLNFLANPLPCATNQVAQWNGAAWTCATLPASTVYNAGAGLLLSNNTFSVNTATIQARVSGACPSGSALSLINADGTLSCQSFWSLTGNAGTISSTNFLGTTDNQPLVFRTNNAEAMRLDNTGRLGIGTVSPNEQLEITGNFRLPATTATTGIIKQGNATLIHSYGIDNFFAGFNAGNLSMSGGSNMASGAFALNNNTTGQYNTASGGYALSSNSMGSSNTASGDEALILNTTGSRNTAVGGLAGGAYSTGNSNTFLGYGADAASGNLTNATAIGANATVAISNALVLGNNLSVGIGTSAPSRALDVNGVVGVFDNSTKNLNAGIATEQGSQIIDVGINDDAGNRFGGKYNWTQQGGFLRVDARNGSNLISLFGRSAVTSNGVAELGYITSGGSVRFQLGTSQKFSLGGGGTFEIDAPFVPAGRFFVDDNGHVGIGVINPTRILQLQMGGGHALGDGWDTYSSRRFKSNVNTIENALNKVEQLRGVTFDWKENGKHDIGLIAEEVGRVIPEVVKYEANGVDAQSVDYSRLVAVLIESTKEQQKQIVQQRASIETLRREKDSQLAELRQQSGLLEARLSALERTPSASGALVSSGHAVEWLAIGALVLMNGLLLTVVLVHLRRGGRA